MFLSLNRAKSGRISVRIEYDIPSGISSLTPKPPAGSAVSWQFGFEKDGFEYEWTGNSHTPTIEFVVPVNESAPDFDGSYYADVGEWALLSTPNISTSYSYDAAASDLITSVDKTIILEGEGVVNQNEIVYLGDYEDYRRFSSGELFRLIVPAAASLASDPETIVAELAAAGRLFDVGCRSDEVVAIAAPDEPVNWGPGGLATGGSSFWVQDSIPIEGPQTTWIHEYIHTRQGFSLDESTHWLTEATATYCATRLGFELGLLDEAAYTWAVNDQQYDSEILTWPDRWSDYRVPYRKGTKIAAWIDSQIESRGTGAFADVFRNLNAAGERVTHETLREYCTDQILFDTEEFVSDFNRYVQSGGSPGRILPRGVDEDPGATFPRSEWWSVEWPTSEWPTGDLFEDGEFDSGMFSGDSGLSIDISGTTGRIEISVEGSDAEIRSGDRDAEDSDGLNCGLCGAPFDGADECPECGYFNGR